MSMISSDTMDCMHTVRRLYSYFHPSSYRLKLDLQCPERTFSGTVYIAGTKASDTHPIVLHAKQLSIETVIANGASVGYQLKDDELWLDTTIPTGNCVLEITFSGIITDAMHGLYPCYFDVDGVAKELLATQFESHHAREVFPCIDEPEAKSTFDVTLVTESGVEVLSNMPECAEAREEADGRRTTKFQTTPRMSTYLLAFVIGELQNVSAVSQHGVLVNIWATHAQSRGSLDFALDTATRAIDFYDEYFGIPYPLPKADHVALPDFSAGAMENWGLITYRESALLAEPDAAQTTKEYVATVVAHELSHQWFGNLVTMQWWDNLWLNESFASVMEYVCLDALHPEWRVWDDMTQQEGIPALKRDAIDGIQAVQTTVKHPDEIGTLFDGAIVYAKGARLMRMLLEYVGNATFRSGLNTYFNQYAYSTTTADNLWDIMSSASGKDIARLMNKWIAQPGYPLVTVGSDSISQEQFFIGAHQPNSSLWPIPLFSNTPEFPELFVAHSLQITIPDTLILNTNDRAHFITRYDSDHLTALRKLIAEKKISPVDRLRLLHEQSLLIEAERLDASESIAFLLAYQQETEQPVWSMVTAVARGLRKFTEQDKHANKLLDNFYAKLIDAPYKRFGWNARHDETPADTQLRGDILGLAVHSHASAMIKPAEEIFHTTAIEDIDANIRIPVLRAVLSLQKDTTLFNRLFTLYAQTSLPELKQDLMYALASVTDIHARDTILGSFTDASVIRPQDTKLWYMLLLGVGENRSETWQWLVKNWTWIDATYKGDMSYDRFVQYCGNYLSTQHELDEFCAFFADKQTIPGLTRAIDIAEKQITARVSLIKHQSQNLITAIQRSTT